MHNHARPLIYTMCSVTPHYRLLKDGTVDPSLSYYHELTNHEQLGTWVLDNYLIKHSRPLVYTT